MPDMADGHPECETFNVCTVKPTGAAPQRGLGNDHQFEDEDSMMLMYSGMAPSDTDKLRVTSDGTTISVTGLKSTFALTALILGLTVKVKATDVGLLPSSKEVLPVCDGR